MMDGDFWSEIYNESRQIMKTKIDQQIKRLTFRTVTKLEAEISGVVSEEEKDDIRDSTKEALLKATRRVIGEMEEKLDREFDDKVRVAEERRRRNKGSSQ